MADNYSYTPGSGATAASDDIGGVHYPRLKVSWGVDGAAVDASATNPFPVNSRPATGIGDGRTVVTTAGTRVALVSSTACVEVTITAETDNTGTIVVGGTTCVAALATRRGTPLAAGVSVTLPIDDLNKVNLDSTVSGDGVTYTYLTG